MYPAIPIELTQNAVQMVVYFVTVLGVLISTIMGGRA
jgi:hypothetical protein